MKLLFDTNIFIYHFNNQLPEPGTALLQEGITGEGAYSVITRIEVLGYKQSE
jgi:predicted nucleic acid-binding protein